MERINFQAIEKKWQKVFPSQNLSNKKGKKFYCLEMFPYPSVKNTYGACEKLYNWRCYSAI